MDKEDKNMMLDIGKVKKIGLFASGVLFGTAGVKVLGSKDAKKFYINCSSLQIEKNILLFFGKSFLH